MRYFFLHKVYQNLSTKRSHWYTGTSISIRPSQRKHPRYLKDFDAAVNHVSFHRETRSLHRVAEIGHEEASTLVKRST